MSLKDMLPQSMQSVSSSFSSVEERFKDIVSSISSHFHTRSSTNSMSKFPALDVSSSDTQIMIKAELPSLKESDIKVDVSKNQLFISGEKRCETEEKEGTYHINEIEYGRFSRSISFPFNIDTSKIKASFLNGVLTIKIEKPQEEKLTLQNIPLSKAD